MSEERDMDKKEWFDAQMRIVEHYSAGCGGRMGNGWKISLALWSSLGLLAGALITKRVSIGDDNFRCVVAVWLIVLLSVVLLTYLLLVWVIGYDNRQDSKRIRRTLKPVLEKIELAAPRRVKCALLVYYSQIFQTVITIVLLAFVAGAFLIATSSKSEQTLTTESTSLNAKCVINNGEMKWLNKH